MAEFTGVVRWFNNAKGYGFLSREDGPDVFCHFSAIQTDGYKSLREGDFVSYNIITGEKGLQADQVTTRDPYQPAPGTHTPAPAQHEAVSHSL